MDAVHAPYCRHASDQYIDELNRESRLGKSFFGDAEDNSASTDCYDAGIRGVDDFISEIFQIASGITAPTMVLYFSDHGEAPTLGTGHIPAKHSHYHNEVPFLVFVNRSGKNFFHREIEDAKSNIDKPVLLSNVYESLLDVIDIDASYESSRSIFDPEYQSPRRILNDMRPVYYDSLEIDDAKDAYERNRIISGEIRRNDEESWQRIWAYRVNSIGKLLEAKQIFSGVEVDIVFDGQVFLVHSPPKEPVGLTLEQWLEATRDRGNLQLWFDWENPNPESFPEAKERLEYLDNRFNVKHRAVLETSSQAPFSELAELTLRQWRHSYDLPHEEIEHCLSSDSRAVCELTADLIVDSLDRIGATAISYDISLQAFIDRYRSAFRNVSLLARHPELQDEYMLTEEFQNELKTHEVLLVPFRTYFSQ